MASVEIMVNEWLDLYIVVDYVYILVLYSHLLIPNHKFTTPGRKEVLMDGKAKQPKKESKVTLIGIR